MDEMSIDVYTVFLSNDFSSIPQISNKNTIHICIIATGISKGFLKGICVKSIIHKSKYKDHTKNPARLFL